MIRIFCAKLTGQICCASCIMTYLFNIYYELCATAKHCTVIIRHMYSNRRNVELLNALW